MNTVPFSDSPKLALLDWDGTFCDSRPGIYQMNLVMAEQYGVHMPSYTRWLQASHPSVEECMEGLGVTTSREEIKNFFNRLLVEQRESGFQNPLYPGTEDFLKLLQDLVIPAIIISRHLHEHLVQDIEAHGLSGYFQQIIGQPADVTLEKDAVMRQICDEAQIDYSQAFYLGDTSHDMLLARKAGVRTVAVSHGYDPVSELIETGPDHIYGSLPEIERAFRFYG